MIALLVIVALLALAPAAHAAPPDDPACLSLAGGATGVPFVGAQIPSTSQSGGYGPLAPASVRLPDAIPFRTRRETISHHHAFALREGRIYVRPVRDFQIVAEEPWHVLELPPCLDGKVTGISADGSQFVALGPGRQVFTNDMPGGNVAADRWTWRWGPYFWTGSGIRIWDDVTTWATSELTGSERFTDTSGREQTPIGVMTVYLLRGEDHRITYIDPWLPNDDSREVCGPRRNTTRFAGLSGSGSTVFAVSRRGRLYTRLYDFDVSGANTVFGDYSWETDRPASDTRWQLPGPLWKRHRAPRGRITDRISITRTGLHADDRVLRVEGRRGYFEKPITAKRWAFVRTGKRARGRRLPLPARPPRTPQDLRYAGAIAGRPAEVIDFNAECSPAELRIDVGDGVVARLVMHSSDGLRQELRAHGLDDYPREYNGAIEVPADLDPRAAAWVAAQLGPGRFLTNPLAVTATRMKSLSKCWS